MNFLNIVIPIGTTSTLT